MDDNAIRVLLIEDNPGDARLIREMLGEAAGASFDLEQADHLATGLEHLAKGGIDVVLLDLGLPDSQGLETFLQARAHLSRLPCIMLTGLDDELVALQAVREGAQDYFVKGQFEGNALARGIRYAIERKQAEVALRESEERLRTVITNAPVGLFATDRDGVFTLSRGKGLAALRLLRPEELEGRSVFDVYHDVPQIIENVRRAQAGEVFVDDVEAAGLTLEVHYGPMQDRNGDICGIIGVATDITGRKRTEDALNQSVAELERQTEELEAFSYSISHDLKEPLRTLEAFSQFLLEDYADRLDEQGRDYLTRIARASARLKQMIEDLLLLSRIGRRPEAAERANVGQVATNIVAAMQMIIEEKGASVEVEDGMPDIEADLAHTQQIFGNLIGNALKFSHHDHPIVKVGLQSIDGGMGTFYVQDNGIGIDPQYHNQIFGVFQRLHKREEYEGTGAGLAIVKRAAEAIGGRVSLQSQPGAGATFFVRLPLWQGTARSLKSQAA